MTKPLRVQGIRDRTCQGEGDKMTGPVRVKGNKMTDLVTVKG